MLYNIICVGFFVIEYFMVKFVNVGWYVYVIYGEDDMICFVECGIVLS